MERPLLEPSIAPHSTSNPPVALTIAGHDPSSGAGITADLLVFQAHGIFGTTAITALTVQSTLGVEVVEPVPGRLLGHTLERLNLDLPPAGTKIGMLGSEDVVVAVADFIEELTSSKSDNPHIPIVLDPVISSSSGARLLAPGALKSVQERLLPLVDWITPNWSELALLSGQTVASMAEAEVAATILMQSYPKLNLIVTGGDQEVPTDLFLPAHGQLMYLSGEHIETNSTHGTGCAFSTSFLSNLIHRIPPLEASQRAKRYVAEAICRAPNLGHGRGPLNLLWPLQPTE